MKKTLILGSSSPYRKALLEKLKLPFTCHSPNIDETPQEGESAQDLVKRLTLEKAFAVNDFVDEKNGLIITSDQVALHDGEILGKPLSQEKAIKQLTRFSGEKVTFLTGLCVFDQASKTPLYQASLFHVYFRELTIREIQKYVELELPLDCAGSFKCEGLGVCLFNKMEGEDPNSLIGLPLIKLCSMLREFGINPIA